MIRFATIPLVLICVAPAALSDAVRIETSKDGRETVLLRPSATDGQVITRGAGVPFGTTPDWQNSIRRQVGSVRVADMNNDQAGDVLVGCYISQSFPPYTDWENYIYYNVGGTPEANPSWTSSVERHTGDLQVGDVNLDTYPDIVSVDGGSSFSPVIMFYGAAAGPDTVPDWQSTPPIAGWATSGLLFDIDHDNDLDLLTTNQGLDPNPYRPIYFFRNNAGALETTPSWQSAESSIQNTAAAADYDGDGWLDVAVAKWVNFQSAIYRNVNGTLQTTPIWTDGSTASKRGVAWADVDDNGSPDLMIGSSPTALWSNDDGALSVTWTSGATFFGQQEIAFCDVDRDGDQDYAEVNFSNGQTHIYLNNGGVLSSTPSWTYDSPNVGNAIAFGDVNGDQWPDLVIGTSGQPCVVIFYNLAPPLPGDMNCDGQVNILDINAFTLAVSDPLAYAAAYPECDITAGDLNGDGNVDILDINPFVALLSGG
ncbi:FG-GAP repeat protein [Phycisphaerae bacterium RAS1]|nr:FG-GAP repeat protein [Phycisphaerae bacterium RAS1]